MCACVHMQIFSRTQRLTLWLQLQWICTALVVFSRLFLAICSFFYFSVHRPPLSLIIPSLRSVCPPASPKQPVLSPLLLSVYAAGQQCGSSVVSIIIVQSALLSTRNCQHSTNTRLAINAISPPFSFPLLSFPLLSCPFLLSPLLLHCQNLCLVTPLSSPLSSLIISSPPLFPFFTFFPIDYFGLISYLPLSSFCLLLVVVNSRSVWRWWGRGERRREEAKGESVYNWLFKVWQKEEGKGGVWTCMCWEAVDSGKEKARRCFFFVLV